MSDNGNIPKDQETLATLPTNGDSHAGLDYAGPSTPPPQANPLLRIHAALRGRYLVAAILALIGGAIGAVVGWKVSPPTYQSTAYISFNANLPAIMPGAVNNTIPDFMGYVDSQMALLTSDRVVSLALQDPAWLALKKNGASKQAEAGFLNNLTTTHNRGDNFVTVQYVDATADGARIGVTCLVEAFKSLFGSDELGSQNAQGDALQNRETALTQAMTARDIQMADLAKGYGPSNIDRILDSAEQALNEKAKELSENQQELALANISTTRPVEYTDDMLATRDREMMELMRQKDGYNEQLNEARVNLDEQHPTVLRLKAEIDTVEQQIQQKGDKLRAQYAAMPASARGGIDAEGKPVKSPDQLRDVVNTLQKQYDDMKASVSDLSTKSSKIKALVADQDADRKSKDELEEKIAANASIQDMGGHLDRVTDGNQPPQAYKDRRMPLAAGVGLMLAVCGVGLVILRGIMDQRIRYISDVGNQGGARILGVLPDLPKDLSNAEQMAIAAHAVHQIRTQLQKKRPAGQRLVLTITSPSPGAGKTSLSVALGLSFAASGSRTLLVDCDMVGGGLTSHMKPLSRPAAGDALLRDGRITGQQLSDAVEQARRTGQSVDAALLAMGAITQEDLDAAMGAMHDGHPGLREVINGSPVDRCVIPGGVPGLWLMPHGEADRRHSAQVTYAAMRRVLEQIGNRFDVIVLDTGPILGSLEGPVAAMVADEVVLTVNRLERQPMVKEAVTALTNSQAKLAGLVMNRAKGTDVVAYSYSSSTRRSGNGRMSEKPSRMIEQDTLELDPVGHAVARLTDCRSEGDSRAA